MNLSEAIEIFIQNQRSSNTAKLYKKFLDDFCMFLGNVQIESIRIQDITKYENYRNSISTEIQTSNALLCLRSFFRYYRTKYGMNVLSNEQIIVNRPPTDHWKNIPMDQLTKLFASFDQKNIVDLRNLCICMTVFCTGVREFELLQLERTGIDWVRGEATILGKGRKKRIIFFTKECLKLLKKYLDMRDDDCPALFVNHCQIDKWNNQPLSASNIRTYMPGWGKKVGIKRLHCHALRKSCGTELHRRSGDIRKVQLILGHSSVNTTQLYTVVEDQELKEFHNRNMGETHEFCISQKASGNIIYEIKGFCSDRGKVVKLKRAIKEAADQILS